MFKLENTTKKLKTTLLALGVTSVFASSILANEASVDGAVKYPIKDGKYGPYHVNTQKVKYDNGRTATKNEINIWNVEVKPD